MFADRKLNDHQLGLLKRAQESDNCPYANSRAVKRGDLGEDLEDCPPHPSFQPHNSSQLKHSTAKKGREALYDSTESGFDMF